MINRKYPEPLEVTLEALKCTLSGRRDPYDREENEVSTTDLENAIYYLEILKDYKTILEGKEHAVPEKATKS